MQELLTREEGLAARLKRARGEIMGKDLAERAGWPPSKVSKIEAGKQLPTREDLGHWAEITNAGPIALEQWLAMLVEATRARRDWASRMREGGQKQVQSDFNTLVEQAAKLQFFEVNFIPRIFQVPGYTRSVITWVNEEQGRQDDIAEVTAERQRSVQYLYTDRAFEMLITEPVLYWRHESLSPAVMRQQLDRLLTIDGLENVRFGILPLGTPFKSWPVSSFEIYGDVVTLETTHHDWDFRDEAEVTKYQRTLARLWETAAEGEAARELIHKAIHALPSS